MNHINQWVLKVNLLVTSRSQEEQEECGLAITGHLSLRWYTVASDRARSRSLVGRQCVCIVYCSGSYIQREGGRDKIET